jgi:hypothetical protein
MCWLANDANEENVRNENQLTTLMHKRTAK